MFRISSSQVLIVASLAVAAPLSGQSPDNPRRVPADTIVEDFQGYANGDSPYTWQRVEGRRLIDVPEKLDRDDDYFEIVEEGTNRFARAFVDNESTQIVRTNDKRLNWTLDLHPYLRWSWRAIELPEGADESRRETNDTGAAVYVTFSRDLLGRPKSIKYAYSSTLPVDTIVRYGRVVIIVASSGIDGTGRWLNVSRDVASDYRLAFGDSPPNRPVSITLWSDTDNTRTRAIADFDNLTLSASR